MSESEKIAEIFKVDGETRSEFVRRIREAQAEHENKGDFPPLAGLVADVVRERDEAVAELGRIRATLLVNFGDVPRNTYGFKVADEGRTEKLSLEVLCQLTAIINRSANV